MDRPRADLRLGYICNNNCLFCCVADQRKFNLTTEEVFDELDFAKRNGAEKVAFTGGEPTLRRDILKIVSYANSKDFKEILIITNGRMTSYPLFLEKLVHAGLTNICFSVPHHKKEKYEYLTQSRGSYEQLLNAFENATKHDLLVSTITTITRLNYEELPEITDFLIKYNKKFKNFFGELMFINPTDNAWTHRKELIPRLADVAPYVKKSLDAAIKNNFVLNVEAIPLCYLQGYDARVVEFHMAKERVFMDPDKKADFKYNENRKIKGKTKSVMCENCKVNNVCEGIWRKYAEFYDRCELRFVPEVEHKLLQVGSICNQNCVFCTQDKFLEADNQKKVFSKEETDISEPNTVFLKDEIFKSKCKKVTFVGGEPTLRKDLPELIAYCKTCGLKDIRLNTNAVRLSDMQYVKKLMSSGLTNLLVSLHTHKPAIADEINGQKGNFMLTIQGIRNSIKQKLNVRIVHVIFEKNYRVLVDFVDFVSKLGMDKIDFVFIKPNDFEVLKVKHLVPKITDIKDYLLTALKKCKDYNIEFTVANFPPCLMGAYREENLQYRQLKTMNMENPYEGWMSQRKLNCEKDEYGYKDAKCKDCKINKYCVGLIKEYKDLYGTKELEPI